MFKIYTILNLPAFSEGVSRQLAGQALRYNLFSIAEKAKKKRISASILNAKWTKNEKWIVTC